MPSSVTVRRLRRSPMLFAGAAVAALVATALPAVSSTPAAGVQWSDYGFQGEGHARVDDVDTRSGRVAPTAGQQAAADRLGATGARWNAFGTPHVLINHDGYLSGPHAGEPADVARAFIRENAELFRLSEQGLAGLELVRAAPLYDSPDLARVYREKKPAANPDVPHVVLFRQSFGDLQAALDGLLTVGVQRDGSVAFVSSSVTGDGAVSNQQRVAAVEAVAIAARDVDMDLDALSEVATPQDPYTTFEVEGLSDVQRARLVALPTPQDGVRRAWEVTLLDTTLDEHGNPTAFISFVDAETGQVWQRSNRVEHFAQTQAGDEDHLPTWRVFPANPPFVTDADKSNDSTDTRLLWCWDNATDPRECEEEQRNLASRLPWDTRPPGVPTFTTDGNNATTAISEVSFLTPDTAFDRPISPSRRFDFPWKNRWFESSCNPTNFTTVGIDGNDESAATTNLFVMHNRMHDWSYFLGFTEENFNMQVSDFGNSSPNRENDPEVGQAQGGRRTPVFGRDNANQITLQDGIAPITNQYLWQPLAGAFYSPCVDGAYDMAVVAHEYTHAITNRMIGGPDGGTGPTQGQTESWSDLGFAAYFTEFAISAGEDVDPLVLGPYVTGDTISGIRNYSMSDSPLNYSNLEYDGSGLTSPHANGEIWSAVNFDIFTSLAKKYDAQFPSKDDALQGSCARGELPADRCPGNRRWNQIQFDSFLLQPSGVSMVDSRDAMLAADRLRFGGANQRELWDAFARRGLGGTAFSETPTSGGLLGSSQLFLDATPGFDSPLRADEARVRFAAPAGVTGMQVYVGQYEARSTPAADTVADTAIDEVVDFIPGTYEFLARADGFGHQRFTRTFRPGEDVTVEVPFRRNLASLHSGATIDGDGVNLDRLIDDTEATNWASLQSKGTASEGKGEGAQVEGRQVTVDLAGSQPHNVAEVQISAVLRGALTEDESGDSPPDPGSQSRFSALRSFDIFTCNDASQGSDCANGDGFTKVFSSADDAFPSRRPRPKVPDLLLRPFDVRDTKATHVRLVVRDNQCTGGPDFQGETNPDSDPNFNPDCDTETKTPDRRVLNPPFNQVRAAELQVFSTPSTGNEPGRSSAGKRARGESEVPRQDGNGSAGPTGSIKRGPLGGAVGPHTAGTPQ
jgi:extracellular elastinolytic metalloproteinase